MYMISNRLFVTTWKLLVVLSEIDVDGVKTSNAKRLAKLSLKNMTKAKRFSKHKMI